MVIWENNLKGGWRVENVRPLDGDPVMKWEGEVTLGEDDVQTLQWNAEGEHIVGIRSGYDLKPTAQKGNCLWRYLELDEIPEIALQLVQDRKPVEVRMRNSADDDWSNEQLVGLRLAEGEYGSVIYFIDAIGGEWLYCQDYREPVGAQ